MHRSLALAFVVACHAPPVAAPLGAPRLRADAAKIATLVRSDAGRRFIDAVAELPSIAPRTLLSDAGKTRVYTPAAAAQLPASERASLIRREIDEETYWETRYGSPLSYARALDVLDSHRVRLPARMLDFGYGYIGHLRLLAILGVDVVGVDVDPLLPVLYAWPGDQGAIGRGRVRLVHGRFPYDPATVAAVGQRYDLVVSKNVLKRGYIHPDRPANPKQLIDLGVSDEDVLAAFHRALEPGGAFLIYNVCPAPTPPDRPFVPWSDGRSPFTRDQWETAGFEVVAFDVDDTPTLRTYARALGWGKDPAEPWDIEHDLSVLYTLARKR
jgi:SAM-dependent methyltransferase